jgi:hypothetical protein
MVALCLVGAGLFAMRGAIWPAAARPVLPPAVSSIRVVLDEHLPQGPLLQLIREAYEPQGIKVVVGMPGDGEDVEEDVMIIGTYLAQPGPRGPRETAVYLWVDLRTGFMHVVDSREVAVGLPQSLKELRPPKLGLDSAPIIDARISTRDGVPTNDLGHVLFTEARTDDGGKRFAELVVYDVDREEAVQRRRIPSEEDGSLFLGDEMLCVACDRGLVLFDVSDLPGLPAGRVFFENVPRSRITEVAVVGRNVLALVNRRLHVIYWPRDQDEAPDVTFIDDRDALRLIVDEEGRIRLFAPPPRIGDNDVWVEVRAGHVSPEGEVSITEKTTGHVWSEPNSYGKASVSGHLGAEVLPYGLTKVTWHEAGKEPYHLVDVVMTKGSPVEVSKKGMPVPLRAPLVLEAFNLREATYTTHEGVRRLPDGSLLAYSSGTIIKFKHYPGRK